MTIRNTAPLKFRIPEPEARPGDTPDFSRLKVCDPGDTPRPSIDCPAAEMRDMAFRLVRVLDPDGRAVGPWDPKLDAEQLRHGLASMLRTRAFDDRMYKAQRQGKTSFYIKSTGEEAISVGQALALDRDDMLFSAYRQQGLLITRGYPMLKMMCQVFSNSGDPLKGRQMPIMYSAREFGFFSVSGNLGTQFSQAVGWAMASAYKSDTRIAAAWIGEGSTAEPDFHYALTLASSYRAPVVLNVVNNQWAISSFQGIASGEAATFASRAIGYGLPSLWVDGNDLLAVVAATQWAVERARANLGATLIEHFTYRREGHSTSDDPTRYRPVDEPDCWPLGDPIARLKQHMIARGLLTEAEHAELDAEITEEVRVTAKEAEALGTLGNAVKPPLASMFEDVYSSPPWHLREQLHEAEEF